MTTQRGAPILDRTITRQVERTVSTPGVSTSTWNALSTVGNPGNGEWRRDSDTMLTIGLNPTSGGAIPFDLEPIDGVTVDIDGVSETLNLTTVQQIRSLLSGAVVALTLTFDGDLPPAGAVLELGIPTGASTPITTTVTLKVWAARRDFTGQDFTTVFQGSVVGVEDRRYVVRSESGPWTRGDQFIAEDGVSTWNVRGVSQIGRSYLEILARDVG